MLPKRWMQAQCVGVSFLCVVTAHARGAMTTAPAPSTGPSSHPVIDPQAQEVLRRMTDFYQALRSASAQIKNEVTFESQGMSSRMSSVDSISLERPNKFAVTHLSGMPGGTVICNGTQLFTCVAMFNKYTVQDAPAHVYQTLNGQGVVTGGLSQNGVMLALQLFAHDPLHEVMEIVQSAKYDGVERIDGVSCDRLEFTHAPLNVTVWIEGGAKPLLRRVVPDEPMEETQGIDQQKMRKNFTIDFTDWQIDPKLPAGTFVFKPPVGAQKVGSIDEMIGKAPSAPATGPVKR